MGGPGMGLRSSAVAMGQCIRYASCRHAANLNARCDNFGSAILCRSPVMCPEHQAPAQALAMLQHGGTRTGALVSHSH